MTRPPLRTPALTAALVGTDGMDRAAALRHIVSTTRFNVLLASPRLLKWLAENDSAEAMVGRCWRAWRQGSGTSSAAVPRPWAAFDSAAAGAGLVVIQITPVIEPSPSCARDAGREPSVVARGIALATAPGYAPERDVRNATAYVASRPVEPAMYGRVDVRHVAPPTTSGSRDTAMQVRLYVDGDEIRPDTLGRFAPLEVRVRTADSSNPTAVFIQPETVREVWYELLPWRITRLSSAVGRIGPVISFPMPEDPTLRVAHERYMTGQLVDAALLSERRLRAGELSTGDEQFARMQIGVVLLQYGDTASARVVFADVLNRAPCLTLSPDAAHGLRRALDQARPHARCTVVPVTSSLRGLLFPGLGQLAAGRRSMAVAVGGLTIATFVTAAVIHSRAEARYDTYLTSTDSRAIPLLYREASELRNTARTAALAAVTLWVLGAVEAVVSESAHARRIGRVQGYGRPSQQSRSREGGGTIDFGVAFAF